MTDRLASPGTWPSAAPFLDDLRRVHCPRLFLATARQRRELAERMPALKVARGLA